MGDYIEREAVMTMLHWYEDYDCSATNKAFGVVDSIRNHISKIKAADVAPVVHGEWEYYTHTMMACSICKRHVPRHKFEYCPHCGAKMDGVNYETD